MSLAELVQDLFKKSYKKPIPPDQWTVLAGIAIKQGDDGPFEVVSFGAGVKCVPLKAYSGSPVLNSCFVHDCHGEVLARRGLVQYAIDQMKKCKEGQGESIFRQSGNGSFELREGIAFHMYVSHAPCGDASMGSYKSETEEADLHTAAKRAKYAEGDQGVRRGREDFSAKLGILRTKPGRADAPPSSCMSCSDKIASWNYLGMQGAMVMTSLVKPLYLSSLTVGDNFDETALERALNTRLPDLPDDDVFKMNRIEIYKAPIGFEHAYKEDKIGAFNSHAWFKGCHKPEVIVQGRLQGATSVMKNKAWIFPRTAAIICKEQIHKDYSELNPGKSYEELKQEPRYKAAKAALLDQPPFKGWIRGAIDGMIQSLRFPTPWPNYALDWNQNSSKFCTLAVASFQKAPQNQIQVVQADTENSVSFSRASKEVSYDYVSTKVMWSPSKIAGKDYLASSGDGINIWKWQEESNGLELVSKLISKANLRKSVGDASALARNPPAPLPSFDWSRVDPTLIVTASYDTTCTVWDIQASAIKTQLIAHDKEVFDTAFSPKSADTFVSVGADGSLRLFDIRSLDHSTIIYETPDARPLLKVAWNPLDTNYLASFSANSQSVVVMDIRMPSIPAAELHGHVSPVLTCTWAPHSSSLLLSGDGDKLRLWDLQNNVASPVWDLAAEQITGNGEAQIHQVVWPASAPNWLAASTPDCIYAFRI